MQIVVEIPDKYLLQSNPTELGQQLKLYTALLMFQVGQLSAGAACEFAGVDRYTFLVACKKHHIEVINYDEESLMAEFEMLKRERSAC